MMAPSIARPVMGNYSVPKAMDSAAGQPASQRMTLKITSSESETSVYDSTANCWMSTNQSMVSRYRSSYAEAQAAPLMGRQLSFSSGPKCPRCERTVYFAEEVIAVGEKWHKSCLKCSKRCSLSMKKNRGKDIWMEMGLMDRREESGGVIEGERERMCVMTETVILLSR